MAKIFIVLMGLTALVQAIDIPDRLNWTQFQEYQICSQVVVAQCFRDMDANNDGIVTKTERDAYYAKNNARINAMNDAMYDSDFKTTDANGDGYVSFAEMEAYGKAFGFLVNKAFVDFIQNLRDGRLDKAEFIKFEKGWPTANLQFNFE